MGKKKGGGGGGGAEAAGGGLGGGPPEPPPEGESRGQLLQRHKREVLGHKKAAKQLGKARKDEAQALERAMLARHAEQLAALEARLAGGAAAPEAAAPEAAAAAPAAEAAAGGAEPKKTKAQKRREKRAKEEAEREARIAEHKANIGETKKMIEDDRIAELLGGLSLGVWEVLADGHCLYKAVEDQLGLIGYPDPPDYLALRRTAAGHMRAHAADFMPFIDEDEDGLPRADDGTTLEERFAKYCHAVEHTAAWGGQLELQALSKALGVRIHVVSADMPIVRMGEGEAGYHAEPAIVSYHKHAFSLGEHFNSTRPFAQRAAADAAGPAEGADREGGEEGAQP